jgi:hypothetical protein
MVTVRMASGAGTFALGSWRGSGRGAFAGGGMMGQEGGDTGSCQMPIPIQLGQTVTGDTTRGRNNGSGSCVSDGDAPEIVYMLQLDRRLLVTAQVEQDQGYDGVVYIREGNCDDPNSEVRDGCNDDETTGDTSHSRVASALNPGTYYIFVDGYGSNHGSYTLTVTGTDVPSPQEVCQNAAVLTPGQRVSGQSSSGDVNVFQSSCANHSPGPDHVYRLDVPQESRVQLIQETDYDGSLYLRRACSDPGAEVSCSDDAEDAQHSRINTIVPPGTYYVFSDSKGGSAQGQFTLEADLAPVAGGGAQGDTCQDAQPLTPGQSVDGNTFAARDDVPTTCGAQQDGYDVVYRLTVANRSRAQLWFESSDLGNNAVIFLSRTCGAGASASQSAIGCRAGAIDDDHALEATLERGQYYVVVDSASPRAFGQFKLRARLEDLTALDRACRANVPALRNHQTVTGTTSGDDHFQSSPSCAGGSRSPENLYRLVVRRRSFVRLGLTSTSHGYDPSIYVRSNCGDPHTEVACNDDAGDQVHSLIETTLDAGTYTVFVDGYSSNNHGTYSLEVTVNPL